ncbi:hypothetical protein [Polyangium sp. 15x6]|uniref:hypothetical protein n=1 Tax=Polyangium sp. 15x6 TaxID=3042687 RepID=UPI00249AABB5|nr:hypothetical protein [Polyangium sp. 15x6]MDI3291958.1 hypothetical protein [Polyangium sp. 15x6]
MMHRTQLTFVAFAAAMLASATAGAQMTTYTVKAPPTSPSDEISLTGPGNTTPASTNATLIASGLMGGMYFGGFTKTTALSKQATVTSQCPGYSTAGNNWPGGCDIYGISRAVNASFGQNWGAANYEGSSTGQNAAVNKQIDAMVYYKSPVLVPLHGSTDHFATIFEIRADRSNSTYTVEYVKYFDGGTPGPDPMDPWSDAKGNGYHDGVKKVSGAIWKLEYYLLLASPPGCNPYCGKYVLAYDPPKGSLLSENKSQVNFAHYPSVLFDDEEMDGLLAEERVWDALYSADVPDDPMMWRRIMSAHVGAASPVYAEDMDGNPMDYYLVPFLSEERGEVAAMVRLSMADGSFEAIWVPTRPVPFMGVTPQEAAFAAQDVLARDEQLVGGTLTWNPRRSLGGSDMVPYYQFYIVSDDGEVRGSIGVAWFDGQVRGIDHTPPRRASVER